jgi:hypothetical protein
MGAAPADQGEVGGVDREPVPGGNGFGEALEIVEGDVDREPTDLAGQVMVLQVVGEVEDRRTMAKVNVVDQPGLFERVDRAIDRRDVDRRSEHLLGGCVQRRRGQVQIVTSSKGPTDRTSRRRDPEAVGSQGVDQLAGFDV